MDLYQRGKGILETFPSVNTEKEAEEFISKYCEDHNVYVTARERCGDSHWNYLNDGTEIDYCKE